jgi:uncharacterized protein involved in exopolysaccharide biosynthesis
MMSCCVSPIQPISAIPWAIVTIISIAGAIFLPSRYESYTTLLVQCEEVLNPFMSFEAAMHGADEDKLSTFNEIIYSRLTIKALIDSIDRSGAQKGLEHTEDAIVHTQAKIRTERRGADAYRITFTDSDPTQAQRSVEFLANLFIETLRQIENRRNEFAVSFYENKLNEIREKFEEIQRKVVLDLQAHAQNTPVENTLRYTQMIETERRLGEIDTRLQNYERQLATLKSKQDFLHTEAGKKALYELQEVSGPLASNLRNLLTKHAEYSRKYTPKYPEMQRLEAEIMDLLEDITLAIEAEIPRLHSQRLELDKLMARILEELKQSNVTQRVSGDTEYDIYKRLYDELTLKLEQAQAARDLGMKGSAHFLIIDPAARPDKPSKPNRPLIVMGGFAAGFLIGIFSMFFAELMDTTVRTPRDIEIYHKPVIALIASGYEKE